jgi:hypothetical protein
MDESHTEPGYFGALALFAIHTTSGKVSSQKPNPQAARTSSSTVRTDNHLKVRFTAKVGEEPEVEVGLV